MKPMLDTDFSPDSAAGAVKQLYALALASFPNVTHEKVGTALHRSASLSKAWADPSRPEHSPSTVAIIRLRQVFPAFGEYIATGIEALVREGPRGPTAHSLEAQANILCGSLSRVLSTHAESMEGDGHYDSDEAARIAAVLASHIETCKRTLTLAEKRAGLDKQTTLAVVAGGGR